jgi:Homing endonuclease associated repeat
MKRQERAAQVIALREDGLFDREIAARLGISRSYAHGLRTDPSGEDAKRRKDSYRRPCPKCGRLMTGSDGRGASAPALCLRCTAEEKSEGREWTAGKVLEAIRRWAETRGEAPVSSEWQATTTAQRTDPDGFRYPHVGIVQREFGTWSRAIEEAGFGSRPIGWKRPKEDAVATEYVVMEAAGKEGIWREIARVEAGTQEAALDRAFGELSENGPPAGRYAALPLRSFVVREPRPVTVTQWVTVDDREPAEEEDR